MSAANPQIGLIGGSGLTRLPGMERLETLRVVTQWGEPSASLRVGRFGGAELVFLARHGDPHRIPPHRVNYRANMQALKDAGVEQVIAVAAVGGIAEFAGPGEIVIPDQIIDYTYGRQHTYFADDLESVTHVDFSYPYDASLRSALLAASYEERLDAHDGATYGATQGPRLETAAEIQRMKRDGADLVGMTGMPEAVLARELGLDYASICLSVNWAAGIDADVITMEQIEAVMETGMERVLRLIRRYLTNL